MPTAAPLAEVLEDLRAVVEELLDAGGTHVCTVEAATLADDGHAGKTREWAGVSGLQDIPCIAFPNAAQAKVVGDVPKAKTVYSVLVKGGAAVTSAARITIHAGDAEPERVMEVKNVLPYFGVVVEVVGLVSI